MGPPEPNFASRILASMSSGVIAIDADHAVVMINEGAKRILGCPDGDVATALGGNCRALLRDQPMVAQLLIDALEAASPLSRAELVLESTGDRDQSTIGFTLSPVRDEADRICGAAMIFRDLTPFERMDEQDRLRERLTALGQMAADLAHEIRNPLAGMQVMAGLLRRRLTDRPDERDLVDRIIGELESVAATVSAGLDFLNPTALAKVELDAAELVESALEAAVSAASFEGVVERKFSDDLGPVCGDPEQLRSLLTNLIANAIDAMRANPESRPPVLSVGLDCVVCEGSRRAIRVRADGNGTSPPETVDREWVVSVADNGEGIPPELHEKIFYPFFTTKARGSGIGLASAQKIAASHGGMIEVASERGAGSSFRLRLPTFRADALAPAVANAGIGPKGRGA